MKLYRNGYFAGMDAAARDGLFERAGQMTAKVSISGPRKKEKSNVFYGGDLFHGQFDPIEQKRAMAKKRAYQVVSDAFGDERKVTGDLKERADHAKKLRREKAEAQRQIFQLDADRENMRVQYGVTPDSTEQQDLEALLWMYKIPGQVYNRPSADELLRAYEIRENDSYTDYQRAALQANSQEERDILQGEYGVEDSSSEQQDLETLLWLKDNESKAPGADAIKRAKQIRQNGTYTEYQARALELEGYKEPYIRTIKICDQGYMDQAGIHEEYAVIRATELERLKKDPMLEASQEAEDILASASDEIIGMLVDEAKEHIEEEQQKEQEKAEERKEEEKQEQEKIEEVREEREKLEELLYPEQAEKKPERPKESEVFSGDVLTESLLKMDALHSGIKQEIEDLAQEMNLIAEDLKGIRVDESL